MHAGPPHLALAGRSTGSATLSPTAPPAAATNSTPQRAPSTARRRRSHHARYYHHSTKPTTAQAETAMTTTTTTLPTGRAVALLLLLLATTATEAANPCNPAQLTPCAGPALFGGAVPPACCAQLRAQQGCLCGYARSPNYGSYIRSPNAARLFAICNLPMPRCRY
jgi:hypothetical protein